MSLFWINVTSCVIHCAIITAVCIQSSPRNDPLTVTPYGPLTRVFHLQIYRRVLLVSAFIRLQSALPSTDCTIRHTVCRWLLHALSAVCAVVTVSTLNNPPDRHRHVSYWATSHNVPLLFQFVSTINLSASPSWRYFIVFKTFQEKCLCLLYEDSVSTSQRTQCASKDQSVNAV